VFNPDYADSAEFDNDLDSLFEAVDDLYTVDAIGRDVDVVIAQVGEVKRLADHLLFKLTGAL
jgi:hypothetical protein